jgi:hypothetical protein
MPAAQRARRPRYVRGIGIFLLDGLNQGGYARHGPSALTFRAPNPLSIVFGNLIRELEQCDFVLPAPFPCGNYILPGCDS